MAQIDPFKNETQSTQIGDLKIENREDRVEMYGTLHLTRDKAGLADALALKKVVDDVVTALKADHALPDRISDDNAPRTSDKVF